MATIAIIGALEKEIMQIKEELSDVCEAREAGLTVVSGELDGLTVVATTAGMLSVGLLTLRKMQSLRTRAPSSSWLARLPRVTAL